MRIAHCRKVLLTAVAVGTLTVFNAQAKTCEQWTAAEVLETLTYVSEHSHDQGVPIIYDVIEVYHRANSPVCTAHIVADVGEIRWIFKAITIGEREYVQGLDATHWRE